MYMQRILIPANERLRLIFVSIDPEGKGAYMYPMLLTCKIVAHYLICIYGSSNTKDNYDNLDSCDCIKFVLIVFLLLLHRFTCILKDI